jgi:hypothetical protein
VVTGVGCSQSSSPVKSADDANLGSADTTSAGTPKIEDKGWSDVEQKDVNTEQKGARKPETETEPKRSSYSAKDNPEPEFKDGGSVDEAINAVPQGLPRENVELDELNGPLSDPELYSSCKLAPTAHFDIKFAVWGGRCVGMDIKTTPKDAKLEACLREIVSKAKWRDKTKSLNTSTVSF